MESQSSQQQSEAVEQEPEDPVIDTAGWPSYKSNWYGFEVKYPLDFNQPVLKSAIAGAKWEYRFEFRKSQADPSLVNYGFDVVVYNVAKVKEVSGTDEFPLIKDLEADKLEACHDIDGRLSDNQNYAAAQLLVGPNDDCYNQAYFFTLNRNQYIYNIVPINVSKGTKAALSHDEIRKNFPQFVSAVASFGLVDIVRPKPVPPKPKINAPMPLTYKVVNGKLVCEKGKKDKPSKSNKGKGKHMDMECCLDPDEYPNPHCYYPPEIYGNLLKKVSK